LKPIDARGLPDATCIDTGLCIVGAGVAGITLAHELAGSREEVCLIESGALAPDEGTQALYDLESVGHPLRPNSMVRVRYFGGSSNLWAGRSMRFDPLDLEPRDWIAGSGWPITYEELVNYYPRAERMLGLPDPMALMPKVKQAQPALFENDALVPKLVTWARRPMRFRKTYRRPLAASPNIRIVLNASVTQLATNEARTHLEAVNASTLSGRKFEIRARRFVLACGGLENPRLLLCANGLGNAHDLVGRYFMEHPRTICGTVRLTAPLRTSLLLGTPLPDGKMQVGIGFGEGLQRRERLLNSYLTLEPRMSAFAQAAYGSSANVVKVLTRQGYAGSRKDMFRAKLPPVRDLAYLLTPKEVMPHWMYRGYAGLKSFSHRFREISELTVINFCEQLPRHDSRVYLSEARDALGVNKLVLDWKIGAEETASLVRLQELLGERLKSRGLGTLDGEELRRGTPAYTDASHHIGTTRMSSSPKQGVVDTECRLHGVDNLYLAGSSVFPTAGCANPTLTLVALALRLADKLKKAA
jgi:choline dehydrogenase-like flavoprotein